jgi:peptidoglycan DL-endopeptidase CwlO
VRDGARRLGPVLWVVAALGVGTAFVARPVASHLPVGAPAAPAAATAGTSNAATQNASARSVAGDGVSADAVFARALAAQAHGTVPVAGGVQMPHHPGVTSLAARAGGTTASSARAARDVAPLRQLRPADLLVVAPTTLRPSVASAVRRLSDVTAVQRLDAATIQVNGRFVQMLGVNPGKFRAFAARPTARSTALWHSVAAGDIAVSYTMGKQDKLPLGSSVRVAGKQTESLRVGGYGTVGIAGVDAVVSDRVAATLGLPSGNALVISAPHARLTALVAKIKRLLPHQAAIAQLIVQTEPGVVVQSQALGAGAAGATTPVADDGSPLTTTEVHNFLKAALSRVGMPYVWGAAGPRSFDCSGLVQWSMRQAGIVMPRVADDQARTGPRVSLSELRPGDLLFYHTDPTAPTYISHVAIYLGDDLMVQAPEPGMNVQIVTAILNGPGFAGAVQVYPAVAAAVAADPAG